MALDWLRPPLPHSWPARPDKSIDAYDDDDHDNDDHDDDDHDDDDHDDG